MQNPKCTHGMQISLHDSENMVSLKHANMREMFQNTQIFCQIKLGPVDFKSKFWIMNTNLTFYFKQINDITY